MGVEEYEDTQYTIMFLCLPIGASYCTLFGKKMLHTIFLVDAPFSGVEADTPS